ncbi:hypothetical protein A9Q83_09785 [Alphaproteobacteria bacterium 46_93_T64]|nr:hypothetical protein A9Q83_09785 [Alphaproteobacteria bacterium 46_93_T64]
MLTVKKTKGNLFSTLAVGALLLGLGATTAEALELRYSDLGPPRGPRADTLKWWAGELDKRTGGEITVKFFWSQSLVKGKETMKAVGSGLSDTGTILGIYTPSELPIWNLANAPFGVQDPWVGMRTWQEMRETVPELRAETKKRNIRIFLNYTTGAVDLVSKDPIRSVEDIAGKKVRTSGGWTNLIKALGATPVKIGFGELYQALDRGTVDATINYVPAAKAYKHYEVAGNMTEIQMGQVLGYGAGINLKTYNKFSAGNKKIFDELGIEFMDQYAKNYLEGAMSAKAAMMAGIDGKKVTFHTVTDVDKWKAAGASYTTDWIAKMNKKGLDAEAFVMKFEATKAKYEAELKAKGYPWTR